jgi:hypothetical protein
MPDSASHRGLRRDPKQDDIINRMTLREMTGLESFTARPAFTALGRVLATDYRGFATRNPTGTVRGSSILFPNPRSGNDERVARQRRVPTSMGWSFIIAGGFQTLGEQRVELETDGGGDTRAEHSGVRDRQPQMDPLSVGVSCRRGTARAARGSCPVRSRCRSSSGSGWLAVSVVGSSGRRRC